MINDGERVDISVENEAVWSTVRGALALRGEHTIRRSTYFYELSFACDLPLDSTADFKQSASACKVRSRGGHSVMSDCSVKGDDA